MEKKIKVGITHGDINGVGYEVILKTFADERITELCTPIIYGSLKIATYYQKSMELPTVSFKIIRTPVEAFDGKVNLVNCVDGEVKVELAKSTPESGKASFQALEKVVSDMKSGAIDALLTAPINKHAIRSDVFRFPGHTEYLESHFGKGDNASKSLMILVHDSLRVALVTGHIPLADVASHLTKQRLTEKLLIFNTSLKQDFCIIRPRIAVLSLNPHAGDNGLLGKEESEIIEPAILEAEKQGMMVFGPYASDGFFGSEMYRKFDGVLAMYHDQGLTPFKTLAMENGVNFTAGLPVVRTSPAHGTAYDIAGQNKASEASFRRALYALLDIHRNRTRYRQMTACPLQKHYIDRGGGDNVKLDLTKEDDISD
ncbi:MAG: 4-hydroxythreonine-4-phosphate dehydrogenase PdxA [Tannerella sp.]|jgi:4-hydroxythreonine-4-phosphate dehydrogenase|nr:4-hydroxythreonine-4-phosphate dehydrogenase PdxA [Tannerella sp.]